MTQLLHQPGPLLMPEGVSWVGWGCEEQMIANLGMEPTLDADGVLYEIVAYIIKNRAKDQRIVAQIIF